MTLEGRRIAITRPLEQAAEWTECFQAAGATVVPFPVVELVPVTGAERDVARERIAAFAERSSPWLAFTSAPAIAFVEAILGEGALPRAYRIASIGAATSAALERAGRGIDLEAPGADARSLAKELIATGAPLNVVHATSDRGLPTLVETITAAGGAAVRVVVYHNRPKRDLDLESILVPPVDLVAFASPSASRALLSMASGARERQRLVEIPALAIGATTEAALLGAGFQNITVASSPGIDDVIEAARRIVS